MILGSYDYDKWFKNTPIWVLFDDEIDSFLRFQVILLREASYLDNVGARKFF